MTASGETYEITVTYDETAGIPEGADLNVSELTEDNSEYASYMERAADTVDAEVTDISYAKFLDISIVDESGKKVVPGALVDVKIKLLDKNNEGEGAEEVTQIVHFAEKKDTVEPELLDNTAEGSTVAFRTDGFSVYAIVSGPLDNPAGGWHSAISGSEIEDLMSEGVSLYIWEKSKKWLTNTNSGDTSGIDIIGTAPNIPVPGTDMAIRTLPLTVTANWFPPQRTEIQSNGSDPVRTNCCGISRYMAVGMKMFLLRMTIMSSRTRLLPSILRL